MIISATEVTEGGQTFCRLEYPDKRRFWACGYVQGTSNVIDYSKVTEENEPEDVTTTRIDGPLILDGFGMDSTDYTYEEFLQEIEDRGLTLPE